jgi:hypothetical protein
MAVSGCISPRTCLRIFLELLEASKPTPVSRSITAWTLLETHLLELAGDFKGAVHNHRSAAGRTGSLPAATTFQGTRRAVAGLRAAELAGSRAPGRFPGVTQHVGRLIEPSPIVEALRNRTPPAGITATFQLRTVGPRT